MVVERAVALGARQATPGEFTARAFLNGRMNLTRAEAVAALIQAESDAQLVAAQAMMRGDLSQAIAQWQENLAELTALVEAEIDFAEEPIEFIAPQELGRRLRDLEREIEELMARSASMSRLDLLPTVLLMGPPNAGKSTLMNALSGVDRSMCSPVAGTTRDILSAPARIGSVEVILLDSAGLAPGQGNAPAPPLTKGGLGGVGIAMMPEISRAVLDRARSVDCVCLVLDPSSDANGIPSEALEPPAGRPTVVAINKIDLLQPNDLEKTRRILEAFRWGPVCPISAKEGLGLDGLRQALNDVLVNAPVIDDCAAIHLNVRQESALRAAKLAIASAAEESGRCGETLDRAELIALCLREGLEALGAVTGAVTTEDLLTTVFANFCIGK